MEKTDPVQPVAPTLWEKLDAIQLEPGTKYLIALHPAYATPYEVNTLMDKLIDLDVAAAVVLLDPTAMQVYKL